MNSENIKKCKDCGNEYPENRDHFGQYKNKRGGVTKIGYRNSCRKCMAKNTAKHSAENPELVRNRLDRRQGLEDNASGYYSELDIRKIRRELNDLCRFCNSPLKGIGEIEHLTPLSRGGTNNKGNLTLSCINCNREKTNKTLEEYLEWRVERGMKNRVISLPSENPDKATIKKGRKNY